MTNFGDIINICRNFLDQCLAGLETVWTVFNLTLNDLIPSYIPGFIIPSWILDITNLGDYTLFEITLGIGLPFIIVWSLAKWITGIVA